MAERLKRRLHLISINLLVVYRESVNLIGYITRRLSADSLQLWIANENRLRLVDYLLKLVVYHSEIVLDSYW